MYSAVISYFSISIKLFSQKLFHIYLIKCLNETKKSVDSSVDSIKRRELISGTVSNDLSDSCFQVTYATLLQSARGVNASSTMHEYYK